MPGTTREQRERSTTALQCSRRTPVLFYLRHSPRLRHLKHPSDLTGTGYHAGRRSPSPVIVNRRMVSHVARSTRLRQDTLCTRLPPRHSFNSLGRASYFGGQKTETPPLPVSALCSRFGTVSDHAYRQGLDAPFIVELFAASRLTRTPSVVIRPVPGVATLEAPDAGRR